ncbi:MAG: NGG1p interacting factor NIF3 [Gammaproteobacteria bacterium]
MTQLYRIEFYVPETHLEVVKEALFAAGAGRVGDYEKCAWQTRGAGQFKPGDNSSPFIGSAGELETVVEFKVELVCAEERLEAAVTAMKAAHPYEEPAYAVLRLESGVGITAGER